MGAFRYPIEIGSRDGARFVPVEAWVDTGATYTWLAGSTLEGLGYQPSVTRQFRLDDGRVIERGMAQAPVRIEGQTLYTLCVFGDEGSELLLGAVTLEEFGLA